MDIDLLSKMVYDLILENDRVALPGVGCFVAEIVPASFSDRGYTINPPYRKLYFRSQPDDGNLLVRLYARANEVTEEAARRIVTDFLAEMKDVLHARKVIVFPGLGRLRATRENNLFFVADEALDIYPEGFGLQPLSLKTHKETAQELSDTMSGIDDILHSGPAAEPVAESAVEPEPEPVSEPAAEPVVEPASEPVAETVPESAAEPVVESFAEPISVPVDEPAVESVSESAPEPTPEQVVEPEPESAEEPVVEPAVESISESAPEPTPEQVVEPEPESAEEPVVEPAVESVSESAPEQVVEQEPEPVAEPASEPVVEPVAEPVAEPTQKRRSPAKVALTVLLSLLLAAAVLFGVFVLLVNCFPDFLDTLLYTKEELEIINYKL